MLIGVIIRHRTAKRPHDAPPPPPPPVAGEVEGGESIPAPPPEKKPRESAPNDKHRRSRKSEATPAGKAELSEKFSADSIVKQYANAEVKSIEEDEEAYNPEDDTPWVMAQSSADETEDVAADDADQKREETDSEMEASQDSSQETDKIIEQIANTSNPQVSRCCCGCCGF